MTQNNPGGRRRVLRQRPDPITEHYPINIYATKAQKNALHSALDTMLQRRGDDDNQASRLDEEVTDLIRVIMDGLK